MHVLCTAKDWSSGVQCGHIISAMQHAFGRIGIEETGRGPTKQGRPAAPWARIGLGRGEPGEDGGVGSPGPSTSPGRPSWHDPDAGLGIGAVCAMLGSLDPMRRKFDLYAYRAFRGLSWPRPDGCCPLYRRGKVQLQSRIPARSTTARASSYHHVRAATQQSRSRGETSCHGGRRSHRSSERGPREGQPIAFHDRDLRLVSVRVAAAGPQGRQVPRPRGKQSRGAARRPRDW